MTVDQDCRGCRILIVEDQMMIVMMIEAVLADLGCEIVGPASSVDRAVSLAREEPLDAAFLDITIRGGQSFPAADVLVERGVPFVLASGYGDWALPDGFKNQLRLVKPFAAEELEAMVRTLCGRSPRLTSGAGDDGPAPV